MTSLESEENKVTTVKSDSDVTIEKKQKKLGSKNREKKQEETHYEKNKAASTSSEAMKKESSKHRRPESPPAVEESSSSEERRRTGRYLAVGVTLIMIFVAFYHTLTRYTSSLTGLLAPVIIMILYVLWLLYFARKRKRQGTIV